MFELQAAFCNWMCDMVDIHYRWARDQAVSLVKIAGYDLGIFWCNIKIVWYS